MFVSWSEHKQVERAQISDSKLARNVSTARIWEGGMVSVEPQKQSLPHANVKTVGQFGRKRQLTTKDVDMLSSIF